MSLDPRFLAFQEAHKNLPPDSEHFNSDCLAFSIEHGINPNGELGTKVSLSGTHSCHPSLVLHHLAQVMAANVIEEHSLADSPGALVPQTDVARSLLFWASMYFAWGEKAFQIDPCSVKFTFESDIPPGDSSSLIPPPDSERGNQE